MERRDNKLSNKKMTGIRVKTLIIIFISLTIQSAFCEDDITAWPKEIKFNYEAGNTYDAQAIKQDGDVITAPEWIYFGKNDEFAYIKGQSDRKIQVCFNSTRESMHLLINLTVTSGTGIGEVCNLFVQDYERLEWITITLDGSVPNSVSKNTFTWEWEVYAISKETNYCSSSGLWNHFSTHTFYTLFDTPVYPQSTPMTEVLDYACVWASGNTNADDVCTDILDNGFNEYYNWTGNCHKLSSDFLHLVSALGISASLHKWASKDEPWSIGDMTKQRTKDFDPVGPAHGYDEQEWFWHQWAEAASSQRDPSANVSLVGEWTDYEDDLFTHYRRKTSSSYVWDENEEGQDNDCEAEGHRTYSTPSHLPFYGPDEA